MSSEAKAVAIVAFMISVTIVSVVGIIHLHNAIVARDAMKNGYVQQQLSGREGVYWTKP